MTFLELCQRLRQECGVPGTGPSAVTGQTGELKRLVDWIVSTWRELQGEQPHWKWMRRPFTLNTVADDDSYAYTDATDVDASAAISRFSYWWAHDQDDPPRAYLQSAGQSTEYQLIYLPWTQWKFLYRVRGGPSAGTPIHVSVDHQSNLVLGPKPNAVFVVSGDFQRSAQVLAADGDTPDMPSDYHMTVVYQAMKKYAGFDAASEVFQRAVLEGDPLYAQLKRNQLPAWCFGGPLE